MTHALLRCFAHILKYWLIAFGLFQLGILFSSEFLYFIGAIGQILAGPTGVYYYWQELGLFRQ